MHTLVRKIGAGLSTAAIAIASFAMPAHAANGYSFFGEANYTSPGNGSSRAVQTVSDDTPGFGGVDFSVSSGLTLADLNQLATDYNVTEGSCGGGSPRFSVEVQTPTGPKNVFFYLGTPPNYTCSPDVWQNSGNLANPANLVDATQLGGTFYQPYASVQATYGSYQVLDISLVTDAGWAVGGNQTVLFDNTDIDGTVYTFEPNVPTSKDQCKQGGWQNLENANGQPFKNQGQCVSYFNHQ